MLIDTSKQYVFLEFRVIGRLFQMQKPETFQTGCSKYGAIDYWYHEI